MPGGRRRSGRQVRSTMMARESLWVVRSSSPPVGLGADGLDFRPYNPGRIEGELDSPGDTLLDDAHRTSR